MTAPARSAGSLSAVPFWRDVRVLRVLAQVVFLVLIAFLLSRLYANMRTNLARQGLVLGYGFLDSTAGFEIGESPIAYTPTDPYRRAFLAGALNTVMVSVTGIAFTTLLGVVMGVARLSTNWLIRQIATAYVLIIRNTPLLLQLFFWYFAIIVQLPGVRESYVLPGSIYLSQRGLYLPWPTPDAGFDAWQPFLLAALASSVVWGLALRLAQRRRDRPLSGWFSLGYGLLPLAIGAIGWRLAPAVPLFIDVPVLAGLNFRGGLRVTPELFALLTGLVVYTGAFISEVVRAGLQAVSRGQVEAARALGLRPGQVLRLVVFPQALRVIIPPLTSQYLNLAKNSSLAIAVGYPDLFSVSLTIANQTGRVVEVVTIIMISYLTVSLITSAIMNIYNRRMALVER